MINDCHNFGICVRCEHLSSKKWLSDENCHLKEKNIRKIFCTYFIIAFAWRSKLIRVRSSFLPSFFFPFKIVPPLTSPWIWGLLEENRDMCSRIDGEI